MAVDAERLGNYAPAKQTALFWVGCVPLAHIDLAGGVSLDETEVGEAMVISSSGKIGNIVSFGLEFQRRTEANAAASESMSARNWPGSLTYEVTSVSSTSRRLRR